MVLLNKIFKNNGTFVLFMDEKDTLLLSLLKEESHLSTRALARKMNMPITTVHTRVKRLKEQGVIKRFTIDIDPKCVNESFSAHVLVSVDLNTLKSLGISQHDVFKKLQQVNGVKTAVIVSGEADIVIFIRTKDAETFDSILFNQIQQVEGVSKTKSLISIFE